MKIVMLNTSDRKGGAAVAAYRLKEALTENGIGVTMIVRDKTTDDPDVISINTGWWKRKINRFRFLWERLMIFCRNGFTRKDLFTVSIADTGTDVSRLPAVRQADIIHLHWINQGFLSLKDIRKLLALGKPVVWTLHDMWPVTGICHYAWTCDRYKAHCRACPFLHTGKERDLSCRTQQKKAAMYTPDIHLVPVSEWLAEKCRESALGKTLPVTRIPNSIDTERFSPGDRFLARKELGLPPDKKILLMGAARIDDPVKGFYRLKEALSKVAPEKRDNILLILFGSFKDADAALKDFPVAVDWWGAVADPDKLCSLYRAADFFVIPSLEDNLPNTVMEALSCGIPVVGFRTGGIPEMVDHLQSGYLATRNKTEELARGIEWGLAYPDSDALSENARKKVLDTFTIEKIASQYIKLYESLLGPDSK